MAKARPYDSQLRREQAATTHRRIVEAALERFAERGYVSTTVADIAAAAGVSVDTVRVHGPKRRLLEEAATLAAFGDEQAHAEVPDIRVAAAYFGVDLSSPASWAAGMSRVITGFNARAAGIFRAWAAAADDDPDAAETWAAQQRVVRDTWTGYVAWLDEQGWITSPRPLADLATAAWLATLADTYDRMTRHLGYDDEGYRTWLAGFLEALLFPR